MILPQIRASGFAPTHTLTVSPLPSVTENAPATTAPPSKARGTSIVVPVAIATGPLPGVAPDASASVTPLDAVSPPVNSADVSKRSLPLPKHET